MRCADSNGESEHGYIHDNNAVDENHCGGPHISASPVAYADGTVRMYQYLYVCCNADPGVGTADCAIWQELWSYNRAEDVPPPE